MHPPLAVKCPKFPAGKQSQLSHPVLYGAGFTGNGFGASGAAAFRTGYRSRCFCLPPLARSQGDDISARGGQPWPIGAGPLWPQEKPSVSPGRSGQRQIAK
jgi:hypothetical protein